VGAADLGFQTPHTLDMCHGRRRDPRDLERATTLMRYSTLRNLDVSVVIGCESTVV
jgi:hypothetical protein